MFVGRTPFPPCKMVAKRHYFLEDLRKVENSRTSNHWFQKHLALLKYGTLTVPFTLPPLILPRVGSCSFLFPWHCAPSPGSVLIQFHLCPTTSFVSVSIANHHPPLLPVFFLRRRPLWWRRRRAPRHGWHGWTQQQTSGQQRIL